MGNHGKLSERIREWMMEYAYLVMIGAVIAVIAGSAMYTKELRRENGVQAAAKAPEIETKEPEPTATHTPKITPLPTLAPLVVRDFAPRGTGGTVWPVDGRIVRAYDTVDPVLWEALSCVQVHAGIDISGEAGERVLCAADGVVEHTVRDELWGWRVVVQQMDGCRATYAGIESVDVTKGQAVTRGQQLGILLEQIPCEAEMGPHLHMELRNKNGVLCDPEAILPPR